MAVRESFSELILDALRDSLAAIREDGGDEYWFTPGAVVRSTWWDPETKLLQTTIKGPIYAIRQGDEVHSEEGTADGDNVAVGVKLEVFLLVATTFNEPGSVHNPPSPTREQLVSRMVQDVVKKLLVDVQLLSVQELRDEGGGIDNVFDEGLVVDRNRAEAGWAVAVLRFTVSYRYGGGRP